MDAEQEVIATLRSEAERLFDAKLTSMERADRILGFGVAFIGVGTTTALANDFEQVMLIVPSTLALLFNYVLHIYADAIVYGIGRSRIEERLAMKLGEEVLIAETLGPLRHAGSSNPSITAVAVFYILMTLGAGVAGGLAAAPLGIVPLAIYLIATASTLVLLFLSCRDLARLWPRARQAVRAWPERPGRT